MHLADRAIWRCPFLGQREDSLPLFLVPLGIGGQSSQDQSWQEIADYINVKGLELELPNCSSRLTK